MLPELRDKEEIEGTPFEYDRWVFELTVTTIAKLGDRNSERELWQPILKLGPKYHYWVRDFLADWMIHGVQAAGSNEKFAACWRDMLVFVLSQANWSNHWRVEELVIEILGLNYGGTSIGNSEDFSPLLEQMIPLFAQAAEKWFHRVRVAQRFAGFLSHPAARALIPHGLRWLWASVSRFSDSTWRGHDNIERDLVAALRTGWQHCSERIGQDETVRDAFLGLLNSLTSRQNHAAIALRDRVLSAFNA